MCLHARDCVSSVHAVLPVRSCNGSRILALGRRNDHTRKKPLLRGEPVLPAEKLRADLDEREKQRKQSADAAKRKVNTAVKP